MAPACARTPGGGRRAARRGRRAPGRRPPPPAGRRRRCAARRPGRSAATPRPGRTARRRTRAPSSGQTTRSPQAPTDSSPISPARPRQAAPPRVAISRASRAVIAPAPCRSLPCSIAVRASSHSDAESADAEPSTPSPTGAPAARSSATGDSPLPRIMLDDGQCAAPDPRRAEPGDLVRRSARPRAPATRGRSSSRRRRGSRPGGGRTCARQNSSSSCVSHRWVCSRTSSSLGQLRRPASSATSRR